MALNWMSGGNRSEESGDLPPTPTAANGTAAQTPASNGAAIHGELFRSVPIKLISFFSAFCFSPSSGVPTDGLLLTFMCDSGYF